MSRLIQYGFFGLLIVGTATVTATVNPLGMAGMTVFMLAYLSKGARRT